MKRLFARSKGQVLVLNTLAIVALLGAIGLCADVAVMYVNSMALQKGTDSAALAGANFLAGLAFTNPASACANQPDSAKKAACTYAYNNGLAVGSENLTITEPSSSTVKVSAKREDLPYYFGRVIGLNTYKLAATSTGQASMAVSTVNRGLFPVGLQCTAPCNLSNMDPGQSVSFGQKFVGGLAPGNWQWLALQGTGDSVLGTSIQYGAIGSFTIGNPVSSEPGNNGNSQNVRNGMANRLASCPVIADPCTSGGGNPNNIPVGDPCLVIVPAVDYQGCTGSCNVTVEGFAQIYLEPTTTGTSIQGCFVNAVAADTVASMTAPQLGAEMPPVLIQ